MTQARFQHLVELPDAAAYLAAVRAADWVVTKHAGTFRLKYHAGWIAVPVEDARLASAVARRPVIATMARDRVQVFAVSLVRFQDYPPVIVPPNDDAVSELFHRYGVFPYVLVPAVPGWAIVQFKDDVTVFAGLPEVVTAVLGGIRPAEATAKFREFVSSGEWSMSASDRFKAVIDRLETVYPNLKENEWISLDTTY